MPELSAGFVEALRPLLEALAAATERTPPQPVLTQDYAVRVGPAHVEVPVRFEVHWRRFGTVPTDLVRQVAYEARRAQAIPGEDEADWTVFAEVFVRDQMLSHD